MGWVATLLAPLDLFLDDALLVGLQVSQLYSVRADHGACVVCGV